MWGLDYILNKFFKPRHSPEGKKARPTIMGLFRGSRAAQILATASLINAPEAMQEKTPADGEGGQPAGGETDPGHEYAKEDAEAESVRLAAEKEGQDESDGNEKTAEEVDGEQREHQEGKSDTERTPGSDGGPIRERRKRKRKKRLEPAYYGDDPLRKLMERHAQAKIRLSNVLVAIDKADRRMINLNIYREEGEITPEEKQRKLEKKQQRIKEAAAEKKKLLESLKKVEGLIAVLETDIEMLAAPREIEAELQRALERAGRDPAEIGMHEGKIRR